MAVYLAHSRMYKCEYPGCNHETVGKGEMDKHLRSHPQDNPFIFENKAALSTKFDIIENEGGGDCLFYSFLDAIGDEEGVNAYDYRSYVCDFYKRIFDGVDFDSNYELDRDKFTAIIREYDPGMPQDDIDMMKLSFESKDEMLEKPPKKRGAKKLRKKTAAQKKGRKTGGTKKTTPKQRHYQAVCEPSTFGSAIDIFILSLVLNYDVYTFLENHDNDRIELYQASCRTTPKNALFLLNSQQYILHFEALIPKHADGAHLFGKLEGQRLAPDAHVRILKIWPDFEFKKADSSSPKKDESSELSFEYNPEDFKSDSSELSSKRKKAVGKRKKNANS